MAGPSVSPCRVCSREAELEVCQPCLKRVYLLASESPDRLGAVWTLRGLHRVDAERLNRELRGLPKRAAGDLRGDLDAAEVLLRHGGDPRLVEMIAAIACCAADAATKTRALGLLFGDGWFLGGFAALRDALFRN